MVHAGRDTKLEAILQIQGLSWHSCTRTLKIMEDEYFSVKYFLRQLRIRIMHMNAATSYPNSIAIKEAQRFLRRKEMATAMNIRPGNGKMLIINMTKPNSRKE